jgi:hypothetical protein
MPSPSPLARLAPPLVLALAAGTCVSSDFEDGQFRCEPGGAESCPPGLACIDGLCRSAKGAPPSTASGGSAGTPDPGGGGQVGGGGEDQGPSGSQSGAGGGAAGSGGAAACGAKPTSCAEACAALWCCAQEKDAMGAKLCPGLDRALQQDFLKQCVECCAQVMTAIAVVNPDQCESTVSTLKQTSKSFDDSCENGTLQNGGCSG